MAFVQAVGVEDVSHLSLCESVMLNKPPSSLNNTYPVESDPASIHPWWFYHVNLVGHPGRGTETACMGYTGGAYCLAVFL